MKKIMIVSIVVMLTSMNLSAQSDMFFRSQYERYHVDEEWLMMPKLPDSHGLDYNYPADVSISSGLLLMTILGIGYGTRKGRSCE